jgi:hypothetical protein
MKLREGTAVKLSDTWSKGLQSEMTEGWRVCRAATDGAENLCAAPGKPGSTTRGAVAAR